MGNSRNNSNNRNRKRHLAKKAKKAHKVDVANLNRHISISEQTRKQKSVFRLNLSRETATETCVNNVNII